MAYWMEGPRDYRCPDCGGNDGHHYSGCPNEEGEPDYDDQQPPEDWSHDPDLDGPRVPLFDFDPYDPFGEDDRAAMKEAERWL